MLTHLYPFKFISVCCFVHTSSLRVKPVLNWANVCSPNMLRTLRRTMIRFLIELLVRRIWFGQSKLYFILNWLVMRCKLRPNLRQICSRQHDRKCRVKSSQYTFITPHRLIQLTTISFWVSVTKAAPPTSQQINKFPPKRVKNLATQSSIFILFFLHPQESSALSQSEAMIVQ